MNVGLNDDNVFGNEVYILVSNEVAAFSFIEVSGETCDGTNIISGFCESGVVMYSLTNQQVGNIDCT